MTRIWEFRRWLVVFGILAAIALFTFFFGVLLFHWAFEGVVVNRMVNRIVDVSGWNSSVVRALTMIATLPLMLAALNLVTLRRSKRFLGLSPKYSYVIIILYTAGYLLLMAFAGRGNFFSFQGGEALKYYVLTPEGVRFFDAPGTDPKYGIELQPVTPELVDSLERARLGLVPARLKLTSVEEIDFFDRLSGAPAVWYTRGGGEIQLYSDPGVEPVYGRPLRPITPEIVAEVQRALLESRQRDVERQAAELEASRQASRARAESEAAQRKREAREEAQRLRNRYFNLSERPDTAVQVVAEANELAVPLNQHLADSVRGSSSFLRSEFSRGPIFSSAFEGDTRELEQFADVLPNRIVLGRLRVRQSPSKLRENLTRLDGVLDVRVIEAGSGFRSWTLRFDATSTQFSAVDALRAVSEELAQKAAAALR